MRPVGPQRASRDRVGEMSQDVETVTAELARLRDCVAGLVGIMALPAAPPGSDPVEVLNALLDALLVLQNLEFAAASVSLNRGGWLQKGGVPIKGWGRT